MTPSCPDAGSAVRGAHPHPGSDRRRRGFWAAVLIASFLPGALPITATLLRGPGSGIELCPVHLVSGFWCPLCGGTRSLYSLLHGDVTAALGYNPIAPVVLLLGAAVAGRWLLGLRQGALRPPLSGREMAMVLCLLAAFGVLRNLPGMWVHLGPLLGPPG